MNNSVLLENLRVIPHFPKKGIMFEDVTSLFRNAECMQIMCKEMVDYYRDKGITKVVGIESRGFMLSGVVGKEMNAGVVMRRKPNKLPGNVVKISYTKEYGTDTLEISEGSINENDVVLIHDDLLATGGTIKAAIDLVKMFKPKKIYVSFIIDLMIEGLNGKDGFDPDIDIFSILEIREEELKEQLKRQNLTLE